MLQVDVPVRALPAVASRLIPAKLVDDVLASTPVFQRPVGSQEPSVGERRQLVAHHKQRQRVALRVAEICFSSSSRAQTGQACSGPMRSSTSARHEWTERSIDMCAPSSQFLSSKFRDGRQRNSFSPEMLHYIGYVTLRNNVI